MQRTKKKVKTMAMEGFLVLDKPQGMTSQAVVSRVKWLLKLKKAGHTGTLDPLATGVLPIALGEATKVISYLKEEQKVYRVKGHLGIVTDSYDACGEILTQKDPKGVDEKALQAVLGDFCGIVEQIPPIYSAIKVKGRPLYSYARKGLKAEIPSRKIEISRIDLEAFQLPHFVLKVFCSRGTYIRSLIHDLGEVLGCGAHVAELRRLQSGPFNTSHALSLEDLQQEPGDIKGRAQSIEDCLNEIPKVELENIEEVQRVTSGVPLYRIQEELGKQGLVARVVALTYASKIVALIAVGEQGKFMYKRVLNRG